MANTTPYTHQLDPGDHLRKAKALAKEIWRELEAHEKRCGKYLAHGVLERTVGPCRKPAGHSGTEHEATVSGLSTVSVRWMDSKDLDEQGWEEIGATTGRVNTPGCSAEHAVGKTCPICGARARSALAQEGENEKTKAVAD